MCIHCHNTQCIHCPNTQCIHLSKSLQSQTKIHELNHQDDIKVWKTDLQGGHAIQNDDITVQNWTKSDKTGRAHGLDGNINKTIFPIGLIATNTDNTFTSGDDTSSLFCHHNCFTHIGVVHRGCPQNPTLQFCKYYFNGTASYLDFCNEDIP